ncbi:MAG TPA: hypothetical protein VF593_10285, partial [Chthoniobacteraceae bacterium]
MEILCFGLSHHTAPIELRERFAISETDAPTLAAQLRNVSGVAEVVIVSTCNRVEFYLAAEDSSAAFAAVGECLGARATLP